MKQKGFSFVELLIVLAIFSILGLVAFTVTSQSKKKSEPTLNLSQMQIKLTTELSQNAKVIYLGRSLYYFCHNGTDALDAVSSYVKENTNLLIIATFSSKENFANTFTAGDINIDLRAIPSRLSISNGTFAVLFQKQ